jgi:hypothetical protein
MQLWEVSIWPNNQPPILLGEYYAASANTAKELAAIENQIKVDDCFCAELAGENSPINRWRKH